MVLNFIISCKRGNDFISWSDKEYFKSVDSCHRYAQKALLQQIERFPDAKEFELNVKVTLKGEVLSNYKYRPTIRK